MDFNKTCIGGENYLGFSSYLIGIRLHALEFLRDIYDTRIPSLHNDQSSGERNKKYIKQIMILHEKREFFFL